MRIVYSVLTFFFVSASSAISAPATPTLFQARGLRKNLCYNEIASLTCPSPQADCALTLFPQTRARLGLTVEKIPEKARKAMGRLFRVEFRVTNDQATRVSLLKWDSIPVETVQKQLARSSGLVAGHECRP